MLVRVDIENLVIVERATFAPGPGLTAVTGETGAGKTLLATAIGLLFGGDADAGQVGPGATQAWIEGEFEVDDEFWSHPEVAALAEVRPDEDGPLVLARRIDAGGRSRALAWGRTVAKSDLAAAGRLLVATAGQHVQVRLRSPEHQRATLDSAGGIELRDCAREMRVAWTAFAAARAEHERVVELASTGGERLEQLRADAEQIDAVAPTLAEEAELHVARDRARHHATLVSSLADASAILDGAGGDGGAIDLAGRAYASVDAVGTLDPELAQLAASLLDAQQQLTEAASTIGSRLADLAEGPGSIDEIEDRLAAYDELHRRFGGTTEAVLATREQVRTELETVEDVSGALDATAKQLAKAEAAARKVAERLTALRCGRADQLGADVADCLRELGMGGSVFRVLVEAAELSVHGADRITFVLAPSVEIEPRPVAQVASGGELSRIALALLVASTGADGGVGHGTILFDEIDAGIGGHTAHAVAMLLRRLADQRQVVCITHLPQVAARADTHVVIEKSPDASGAVRTTLHAIEGEAGVELELMRMLGAAVDDAAAQTHVRQLRGTRYDLTTPASAPAKVRT